MRKIFSVLLLIATFSVIEAKPNDCGYWTTSDGCQVTARNNVGGGWDLWVSCPDGYNGYDHGTSGRIDLSGHFQFAC